MQRDQNRPVLRLKPRVVRAVLIAGAASAVVATVAVSGGPGSGTAGRAPTVAAPAGRTPAATMAPSPTAAGDPVPSGSAEPSQRRSPEESSPASGPPGATPVAVRDTTGADAGSPAGAALTTAPAPPGSTPPKPAPSTVVTGSDLSGPRLKDIAQQLVSSAENSSLDWRAQYGYIEDIKDGRGYTGGLIGFTSGTHDMLELVRHYRDLKPDNPLARYLPALAAVDGSASHQGLDPTFPADWAKAAQDPAFRRAQDDERDRAYFDPAVRQAKADGLRALGQFSYYDAIVMHGPGSDPVSFGGIRAAAMRRARTPAQGGDETTYLNAFLDARRAAMLTERAHHDTSRVDTEQRWFLQAGNLDLAAPLRWRVHGDTYLIGG